MLRLISGWLLFILFFSLPAFSQRGAGGPYIDSLQRALSHAQTTADKVHFLMELSESSFEDPQQADSYRNQAIEAAELSRDRRLMASTYLSVGRHYMNNPGLADNLERASRNIQRSIEIAGANDLQRLQVEGYKMLSTVWQYKGDPQKALSCSNQALSIAGNTQNDTASVAAYVSMGESYLNVNEKLLSFRNFLEALTIAENSGKDDLLRIAYDHLDHFYASIHEYGKAIDYQMKTYALDRKAWLVLNMIQDDYHIGELFAENKQQDLALKMFESAIALADTLHYDLFKLDPYFRIFNMYLNDNQYVKSLTYLEAHPQVLNFLREAGYQFYIDQIRGMSFTEQGRFDSAGYYFTKAEPDLEKKANPEARYFFYTAVAQFHALKKDYPRASSYYTKAYGIGESVKNLEFQQNCTGQLDSVYRLAGDFKTALFYNTRYHAFRDSLQSLNKETELRQLEVKNDDRRRERLAQEEEARVEHRHNVQYMGFTIGLVVLFILLVMLGWFAVPPGVIRALGFLSFIFLFEFIILLADKTIMRWTHEEPWKVLLIKILLAAILVPLHHWLEHKVIHYLSHRKREARMAKQPPATPVNASA